MAKADPRDFLLNTDYEMDKIIYVHNFEHTVSAITTITIPHGLATAPLPFGIWATNSDFTNSHSIGEYDDPWNQDLRCEAWSDMTNVYLKLTPKLENNAYVSTTFYGTIFGFEPGSNWPNYPHTTGTPYEYIKTHGQKIPATSKYAQNFILNTGYNYLKLQASGNLGSWNSTLHRQTYMHNFGYVPQVLVWYTLGAWEGNIEFQADGGSFYYESSEAERSGVFVDDKQFYYQTSVGLFALEARVYADEA